MAGLLAYSCFVAFPLIYSGVGYKTIDGTYSYGDSTGLTPVSLFIPCKTETITKQK